MNFSDLTIQQANEPVRRAAIVAHSLSAEDQGWLFAQMEPTELHQLKVLLAELVQLGVPTDSRLLEQALVGTDSAGAVRASQVVRNLTPPGNSNLDFFVNLDAGSEGALVSALRQEPALLIARFMRIRHWPWKQKVLDGLPALLRQHVNDLLADPSDVSAPGRSLEEALLSAMRLRCERVAVTATQQSPEERSRFGQLKVKAWLKLWGSRRGGQRS
jgi:hypothetical protein